MATKIRANVIIDLPDDKVMVDKTYIEDLEDFRKLNSLDGQTWKMQDLIKHVGHDRAWIKKNILTPFYKELNFENGGPAFIPLDGSNQQYAFNAKEMAKFLEQHFSDIYKNADIAKE